MSSYNDIEPWALHGLTHATCHSDWCQRAGYMPTLYKIRGFTPTDSAITLYTHKLWHRRYFMNREVPYWLQSSITGSAFRGLLLILQKNSTVSEWRHENSWILISHTSGRLSDKLFTEMDCGYRNALPNTCLALLLCTQNSKNIMSINC